MLNLNLLFLQEVDAFIKVLEENNGIEVERCHDAGFAVGYLNNNSEKTN